MSSIFTAHIEKKPIHSLLKEIALQETTGIALLKLPNETQYTIHFKEGTIVRLTRTGFSMEKELLSLLKKSGTVSDEAFANAEKKRLNTMRKMLDILMDSGDVSLLLYSKIISALMRQLLINMLYETKGLFTLQVKETVKAFKSVRPIAFISIKRFYEELETQKKKVHRILRDMHNEVSVSNGASLPFKTGLSLFENYLSGDLEFLEFLTSFLFCLKKKRCSLKSNFTTEAISDLLLRIAFRLSTAVAVALFVITIINTDTYTEKAQIQQQGVCEFCVMFKIKTATNFYEFSFDRTPEKSELLSSGLISLQDFKSFQNIKQRQSEESDENKESTLPSDE